MGAIKEKVTYIRGLAEGLDISAQTSEGRVILAIIDALDMMAMSIEETDVTVEELSEEVAELSEDLDLICEDFYGDEDDEDYVLIPCPECGEPIFADDDELDEDGPLICPNCKHEIMPDQSKG